MISQAVVTAGPDPDYAGALKILTDAVCSTANSFAGTRSGSSLWRSIFRAEKPNGRSQPQTAFGGEHNLITTLMHQ